MIEAKALNFFPEAEFEQYSADASQKERYLILARNILRVLMMGWREDWRDLLSFELLNMTYVWTDPLILRAMREAFQQGFDHLYRDVLPHATTDLEIEQANMFISNCLCYLPKADLNPFESYRIPQYINQQWVMVEYKVTPIELTAQTGLSKVFLSEQDRVFAYGLEPMFNLDAEPHLIFLGTNHPAGQGFATQVHTDLEGFHTAGNMLYVSGRQRILDWMAQQAKKPHVCGISLGGALSLLLAIDQGDKISRVDALNPAGLSLYNNKYDRWTHIVEAGDAASVVIQRQGRDPVSRFGVYKPEWTLYQVDAPDDKRGPNSVAEHALNYAGIEGSQFRALDVALDNHERRTRNYWIYGVLRASAYYVCVAPYFYLIRPAINFLINRPICTVFALLGIASQLLFMPTGFPILLTLSLIPLLISTVHALVHTVRTLFHLNTVKPLEAHANTHREQYVDQDLYAELHEAQFDVRELKNYYQIKKSIKNEVHEINLDSKPSRNTARFFSEHTVLTKKEVLEKIEHFADPHEKIMVKGTKAKLHFMKQIAHHERFFPEQAEQQCKTQYIEYKRSCFAK